MVADLWSSRGESMTSKIGFYPGNVQEGLGLCSTLTLGIYSHFMLPAIWHSCYKANCRLL